MTKIEKAALLEKVDDDLAEVGDNLKFVLKAAELGDNKVDHATLTLITLQSVASLAKAVKALRCLAEDL